MYHKVGQRILPHLHHELVSNWQGRKKLENATRKALKEAGHHDLAGDFELVPTILVDNLYSLDNEKPNFKVIHIDICFDGLPLRPSEEMGRKWLSGTNVFQMVLGEMKQSNADLLTLQPPERVICLKDCEDADNLFGLSWEIDELRMKLMKPFTMPQEINY